jgi:hypothetical protein
MISENSEATSVPTSTLPLQAPKIVVAVQNKFLCLSWTHNFSQSEQALRDLYEI